MNKMQEILFDCCTQYRKGEEVETRRVGPMEVVDIYMMDHMDKAPKEEVQVDMEFMVVSINKEAAEKHKADFIAEVAKLPTDIMAVGPSYITLGSELGSQDLAIQFMALGQTLELWKVITPRMLGLKDNDMVRSMVSGGFMMCSPYPDANPQATKDKIKEAEALSAMMNEIQGGGDEQP